jgi:uncharacterized membrane protein
MNCVARYLRHSIQHSNMPCSPVPIANPTFSILPRPAMKSLLISFMATTVAALSVAPAHADFRLCNNTSNRVSVSIAYTDGEAWISEGWWNLKAAACETLVRGPLAAQFYYVYAMDERGAEWKGKAFMCTRDREFRITGREDCFIRGFDRSGFFEVDTGKDARNWTVQLTDPNSAITGR